ncbi:cyclophilin family peptidyl-prolyl cis-trans isomerase [Aneurinibacillus soli]|uniref:Peptidyl-prolyl cis-trans isomerase n=1 Tax=Aneurinibacillus soli TaxID=1500254 RepID=A0A0U5C976_9BACL|nr:peptidylprolyl isomerase [Aneurinibacillus soli]PYE62899.1 cyclophilin family peptidyl-prolyl cis-trans isomerase [Aneurinibacillus soli]BAU29043.1 Peptidyl-prolyl cis-trans isomerase B [Aneurinibacillus soli]
MKKWLTLCIMATLVIVLAIGCSQPQAQTPQNTQKQTPTPQDVPKPAKQWSKAPEMKINPNKKYFAHFDTSKGKFTVELYAKDEPMTVNNFVFLAKQKYYDGNVFHRIIRDFMIQSGDPTGTGAGGPGYQFNDELPNKHKHKKGTLAMANRGPNTNGSQFFIGTGPQVDMLNQPQYDKYVVFGEVTTGLDVVEKIAATPVKESPAREKSLPTEKVVINTITIEEK